MRSSVMRQLRVSKERPQGCFLHRGGPALLLMAQLPRLHALPTLQSDFCHLSEGQIHPAAPLSDFPPLLQEQEPLSANAPPSRLTAGMISLGPDDLGLPHLGPAAPQ